MKYTINYRFLGQTHCKSYKRYFSKEEIILFLKEITNKNDIDYQEVDLIVIDFPTSPTQLGVQLFRKEKKHSCGNCFQCWEDFEISIIINDYVIGKINSVKDLIHLLKIQEIDE